MKKETKEKTIKVTKIVIKTIGALGIVGIAFVAPNALQMFDMFGGNKKRGYYKGRIDTAIGRLKDQGVIKFEKRGSMTYVRLTEKGKEKLLKYQIKELEIKKPKRWDKKWRIITFDIKEKRKSTRNLLRSELMNSGFIRLQNSVWVYPYDCEEFVVMLKAHLKIGKDVLYITANKIENDKWLKKEFDLQ